MRQQSTTGTQLQRKMLPWKRTRKIQRIRLVATFQRQKSSPENLGLLHSDWDFQSLNQQQFLPSKPDFHVQNRLHIPFSETHFQTSHFLVEHIKYLGDSLAHACHPEVLEGPGSGRAVRYYLFVLSHWVYKTMFAQKTKRISATIPIAGFGIKSTFQLKNHYRPIKLNTIIRSLF